MGKTGKKYYYYYKCGNKISRKTAKNKAEKQGRKIFASGWKGS
jgi:hypothetical protein